MKKNERMGFRPCRWFKKIPKKMRLTVLLVFVMVFTGMAASSYSQVNKLNVNLKNVPVQTALSEIEEASGCFFMYKDELFSSRPRVTIQVENGSLVQVLDQLASQASVSYEITDKQIILKERLAVPSMTQQPQQRSVTGIVTSRSGEPLPGVAVMVKGTNVGTSTGSDGKFQLNIPSDAQTLLFSFVGMKPREVGVAGSSTFSVMLEETSFGVEEVVVTALGIEKSKRSLTYATQSVDMEALTTIKDVSLGNSLAGKIAGVSVTASTGSTGVSGDPRIIIRGDRSINGNNQPLIVVDGIPYSSSGGGLSSINPDDVQSMNVLKGPSASALYGSSANNGVIVVTTKRGKTGEPRIEINSASNFDLPYLYPEFQNEYGQGTTGAHNPLSYVTSWGPRMSGQTVTDWTGKEVKFTPQENNVKDFFRTGHNLVNGISYSTGTDKSTAYFSYSNTMAQGVLEDNKLTRHNFNLRLNTELIKNLNMDFRITYFRQHLNDKPVNGDDLFSPMWQLVKMPRSIRTSDIRAGSYYDETFSLKQLTWAPKATEVINPYWAEKGYENPSTSNSVNTYMSLRYDFTKWLYLQLRGGMNTSNSDSEEKTYWDTQYVNSGQGNYVTAFSKGQALTGDVLLVFNKELTKDLRLGLNAGAEIKDNQSRNMRSTTNGMTAENKFALSFAKSIVSTDGELRIQKQSVYGMGQLSFRDYLFLDVTARNDWSSTLPAPYDYFYPSAGVTAIVSDIFNLPEVISFAKLRGSYAEVGNDASWAMIFQTFRSAANGPAGQIYPESTKVPTDLIPEKTKSWEAGAELRFFEDRLGIDFTWYKSNTFNQLVLIKTPPTSGFSSGWINCGNIQNTGIEFLISGTPVKTNDFEWNVDLNFAQNNNKVIELANNMNEYEINAPNLAVGETWAIVGRPFGEIYTYGFMRNEKGQLIVDATGIPKIDNTYDPTPSLYLGNFNYDWRSGITNYFNYKNWNLSFLIDLNYGGVRQSATEAMMLECGTSKESLIGREGGLIVEGVKEDGTPNDKRISAETYAQLIGGRISTGCGEPFNHEATNSRLREFSLGYTFPFTGNLVKSVRLSAVGRNLFYIYNGCNWFDPDVTYDVDRNGQGAESAFLPGTRTLGFNIKLAL